MGIAIQDGVVEDFTGISASDRVSDDGIITGVAQRFFDVTFSVTTEVGQQASTRPMRALSDGRIPQIGQGHPFSDWMYVLNRSAAVDRESPFLFHITINYSEILDPLNQPTIIEWLSAATTEPVDTDINGDPILNSSDEPFDPPITQDFDDLVLRAVYNVASFSPIGAANYKNAVNNAPVTLAGGFFLMGQAKVVVYTSRLIRAITGRPYIEVTVEIHFRHDGWKRKVLDQGYRIKGAIVSGVQEYTPILDDDSEKVTEPVLLDGAGGRLAATGTPVRREFWTNRLLNFTSEFGAFL